MQKWSGFKRYFQTSRFLTLMFSMVREIAVDNTQSAMSVHVTTNKQIYVPGEDVVVSVHLRDFMPEDCGYSYINLMVQYDSDVFENTEFVSQYVYKEEAYAAGHQVSNIFQYNFLSPVDGGVHFGVNNRMRGIDIQVEANSKKAPIPAVDQTLVAFKLRVKKEATAASSLISLANEFTRIRTSEAGSSVYLYAPDITEVPAKAVDIIPYT
ncbi:hypothetical protein [Paenibacillus sp. NFR01]|uniref:hypothetical protein n=1 Tax=Paenibacillus sp. NFR01 TaxID=1566279 RepID=UPI0008AFA418|nr:hypothetical protein [Paenibacillus sp. NFR01]SEU12243.1 hypothetical protein SAMN03159358_3451 [Paenibacillus sp. NFR01]